MTSFDVAVVGGGPAGLSAALVFARAGRQVVVVDGGVVRNHASPGVRGFLSRDGILPARLKEISREQIKLYGATTFLDTQVESVRRVRAGFEVRTDREGSVRARFVLLALGVVDLLPPIPGFRELWGRDVMHCAFCHGSEHRDRAWGLLARSTADVDNAHRLLHWTKDLVVFADPTLPIAHDAASRLALLGIEVVRHTVRQLVVGPRGRLAAVELANGTHVPRDTLVCQPKQRQTELVVRSGVALDGGRVRVDDNRETSIQGIFAAGDLTAGHQDVASAVASGASAAKKMTFLLADGLNAAEWQARPLLTGAYSASIQ